MPVQIGSQAHNFGDPTGLLSDCHRRIEMFMRVLERVAQIIDSPPEGEVRQSLEAALRYFREAAPKHTADEEQSLFPRLRTVESPQLREAFAKLEELELDHRWSEPLHVRIDRLGEQYLLKGRLSEVQVGEFRDSVSELSAMYRRHIAVEDKILFPAAAKALSEADKQRIAEEMAQRRALPLVSPLGGQGF
jgi:hemerythrin-like domain-containing protein